MSMATTTAIFASPATAVGNQYCPRCQGAAARGRLAERVSDLLPIGYFHVVFTPPAEIGDIALHDKTARRRLPR